MKTYPVEVFTPADRSDVVWHEQGAVVVAGGWSAERDESLLAADSVFATLLNQGVATTLVDVATPADLVNLDEAASRVGFVFLCTFEELPLQFLLDRREVPYSGCESSVTDLFYDKLLTHFAFQAVGVPTIETRLWRRTETAMHIDHGLGYPLVIKPCRSGTSFGVSLVHDSGRLRNALEYAAQFDERVLIQPYLSGQEFTAFFLGHQLLSVFRVETPENMWDYEPKVLNTALFHRHDDERVRINLDELGGRLATLGARNFYRVDLRARGDELVPLDVNTLPFLGECPGTSIESLCHVLGITHYGLLDMIAEDAIRSRTAGSRQWPTRAESTGLQVVQTIRATRTIEDSSRSLRKLVADCPDRSTPCPAPLAGRRRRG